MDKRKRPRSLIRKKPGKNRQFPVQVSYAEPDASVVLTLHVRPGTTIREAFELSGIQKIAKNARLAEGRAGIFGEIRPLDTLLQENDRIEIYRPLAASPAETRKKRMAKAESAGRPENPDGKT